jgi:quinol monooxygenase YgiN
MHKNTLKVIATINALKGKEKDLQDVLLKLIEPTRKETGCISYTLLNNIANQSEYTFFEEWKTEKDLEAHMQSSHFQEAVSSLDGLIASEPEIKQYYSMEIG